MSNRILPVIVGPTGVGKTSVGIKLAEIMDGEIVSADSRQVYAGMEIGSGAPTRQEMENIPHHLIGFLSPHLRLSAGEFAKIASKRIEEIFIMGKAPIVVGGSGFYIKALTEGLSPIPQPDMKIRADLSDEVELVGMTKMIAELRKVDPEYAEKVGLNNKKRLIRALEVYRQTGRRFSDWHREATIPPPFETLLFGLDMPRELLHLAISRRVQQMIDSGWKAEVEKLAERYGGFERLPETVVEGLGYGEIVSLICDSLDMNTTVERIVIAVRQYARRQMTWFRADRRISWIKITESGGLKHVPDKIMKLLAIKIPALMDGA